MDGYETQRGTLKPVILAGLRRYSVWQRSGTFPDLHSYSYERFQARLPVDEDVFVELHSAFLEQDDDCRAT